MSEPVIPESIVPEPPKKRGRSRLIDPLVSSVPTLIGVLVGAVTSHVAEIQRVDFEREDRFRRDQVERIASVAHAYDSMTTLLHQMLVPVETQQHWLCRFMPLAATEEAKLRGAGKLNGRLFSPGPVEINETAYYGRQIDALANDPDPAVQRDTKFLKGMIGLYTQLLTDVETADAQFTQKREAFQATLMFEVKVYFPDRVRDDIDKTTRAFTDIAKQVSSVQIPNKLCSLNVIALHNRLVDLTVGSASEMTSFARSLEPELDDSKLGKKS